MKKYLFIALAIFALPLSSMSVHASEKAPEAETTEISPEDAIKNVETFYMTLQNHMNEAKYEEALSMIDQHFAEDFLHYDDGEVSYGKDGMIMFVENNRDMKVRTKMDINIIDTDYMPEKQEVLTKFNISQKFYKFNEAGEEYEDKDARISLMCSDSLRVTTPKEFELYKCDCITKSPNMAHAQSDAPKDVPATQNAETE